MARLDPYQVPSPTAATFALTAMKMAFEMTNSNRARAAPSPGRRHRDAPAAGFALVSITSRQVEGTRCASLIPRDPDKRGAGRRRGFAQKVHLEWLIRTGGDVRGGGCDRGMCVIASSLCVRPCAGDTVGCNLRVYFKCLQPFKTKERCRRLTMHLLPPRVSLSNTGRAC